MYKSVAVKHKSAMVNSGFAQAVAMVGTLVLPKVVQGTNKFTMTGISAAEIVGCEPCQINYNGKAYNGAKVYTVHGSSFKCLVNPSQLLLAQAKAKSSPTALVTVDGLTSLPGYDTEIKLLKAGGAQ